MNAWLAGNFGDDPDTFGHDPDTFGDDSDTVGDDLDTFGVSYRRFFGVVQSEVTTERMVGR